MYRGGIMREREIRPIPLTPGRAGDLYDLCEFLLGLVVGEDVFKVEVLRRQVAGVEAGVVEDLALHVGEGCL